MRLGRDAKTAADDAAQAQKKHREASSVSESLARAFEELLPRLNKVRELDASIASEVRHQKEKETAKQTEEGALTESRTKEKSTQNAFDQALIEKTKLERETACETPDARLYEKHVEITAAIASYTEASNNQIERLTLLKKSRENLKKAEEAVKATAEGGEKIKLGEKIKSAILQPKEFEEGTKLAGVVDKVFGKHAQTVKNGLGKVGIGNGSDLADTAMAVGSAAAVSAGVNEIADDVTEADNDKLAIQGKIKAFEDTVNAADRLVNTFSMLAG